MFITFFGNDPDLLIIGAVLDLIITIILIVVFFGIGRNLKRIKQLLEKKNDLKFSEYAYKPGTKDQYIDENVYFYDEGYISDKEIIGETEDGTPIIKNPKKN